METKIELLSPAGNAAIGRAAIEAGADAVYIGGERFGARRGAANRMSEIEGLVRFAHGFGARVYLTMNTLLFDQELESARQQAWSAYQAGVDALIVQDMAFTQLELPPIPLHASTQTFNMTPQRVQFLARAGFSRIVLERGMSLEQIRAVRQAVPPEVELEAFVHGALCVSYSGQCYLGHALCGRGGNRGNCAQPCRAQYDLLDESGQVLARGKHLLSVADLNLSERLGELIGAGVCSLKIEGRLKEREYVVNNTAYYHQKLTALGVARTSAQSLYTLDFEPNPDKSFSRGFTTYYLDGKRPGVMAAQARSIGEPLGRVEAVYPDGSLDIRFARPDLRVNPGDGICFVGPEGTLCGTNINEAQGRRITPNRIKGLGPGVELYRNFDRSFRPDASRKIAVRILCTANSLTATDSQGIEATVHLDSPRIETAKNRTLIQKALLKSGGTDFVVAQATFAPGEELPFLPLSVWNALRRELLQQLAQHRLDAYRRPEPLLPATSHLPIPPQTADYRANVTNSLSARFYADRNVHIKDWGLETGTRLDGKELLRTPYCVRRELGLCQKPGPGPGPGPGSRSAAPLWLHNNGRRLSLRFDCPACEMAVVEF